MASRWLLNGFCLATALLSIYIATPGHAGQAKSPGNGIISGEELTGIVKLLEDPQRRDAFLMELKSLIQAKEAVAEKLGGEAQIPGKKERPVLAIESLFLHFDALSKSIVNGAASTFSLLAGAPEAWAGSKAFFSVEENRKLLFRLLIDLAGGMFIALLFWVFLRRYVPRTVEGPRRVLSALAVGFVRLIANLAPFGALLLSLFVLFRLLPSFALAHALSLLFFMVLFFYRMAVEIFRALLSPEEDKLRILPFGDENASYLWLWSLRFARYTGFYVLVSKTLLLAEVSPSANAFVRGILLLVFPVLISIFILQVSREIRIRSERRGVEMDRNGAKNDSKTIGSIFLRYWHVVGIAYAWAVFLFLIFSYERGFGYLFRATIESAITILAILGAQRILAWLFERLFAISERVKQRVPGIEEKANRYMLFARKVLDVIIVTLGVGVVAEIWGIPVSDFVVSRAGSAFILRALAIALTVGVVVLVIQASQFLSEYLLKHKKDKKKKAPTQKMKTLLPISTTAVKFAAVFIGGIVILDQLGVNTTPILAGAGIVGLAVGFGSQTLVRDLINGLFILFEESLRVGDYAEAGNKGGIVESVGLRTVRLRDLHGNVHVIPNSSINTVTNYSKEFSRAVIDIGVAYRENVDEVIEILKGIGEEMRSDPEHGKSILEPMEVFGLQSFADSAVVIRVRFTTKPLKQWGLKREFQRRVKRVFDERGIEIPFPHRTVYMGEPKIGPAPPLHLVVKEDKDDGKSPGEEKTV